MKPEIIVENDFFVAVNKPSGLLSIPDRMGHEVSLKDLLKERYGNIYTVHRLDKDTSGVIVFAKDDATHKTLSQLFEGRDVEKNYHGLVYGNLIHEAGTIDAAIMEHPSKNAKMITHVKGKHAITDYQVTERFKHYDWVQFRIHTGRTHQIRVHMQHIGHSIICDPIYGDAHPLLLSSIKKQYKLAKSAEEEKPLLARLALHSSQLKFTLEDQIFDINAPLPKDLKAVLQQLRKRDMKK